MKSILKTAIISFVITVFTSCSDKIEVKMNGDGKTLTVDAFLNTLRQDQKIRLTYTDNYFSGTTPPVLSGASVMLRDITVNKEFRFSDNKDGSYSYVLSATDTMVKVNHTYELNIKYLNYEYHAVTACRRAAKIDNVYFEHRSIPANNGKGSISGNILMLSAKDLTGPEPDFYWIKNYKNGKYYNRPENIQLDYFGYNNEFDGKYFNPFIWSTSGPEGKTDPCLPGDIARVEIHGISREVFEFLTLGKQMSNNGGLFATTPINLPTNILPMDKNYPKAVGMFSVSEVTFKELVSQ